MKMYRTKLRIIVPVEIEAESDDEAERIIDGVIENVTSAGIIEGDIDDYDDYLLAKPERLERDEIKIIPE